MTMSDLFGSSTDLFIFGSPDGCEKFMTTSDPRESEAIRSVQQLWVSTWEGMPWPGS